VRKQINEKHRNEIGTCVWNVGILCHGWEDNLGWIITSTR
jgi:hypothetical protein